MPTTSQQRPPVSPAGPARPASPRPGGDEPGCPCPPAPGKPLPDLAAMRLLRVPETAPPYDVPSPGDTPLAGWWHPAGAAPAWTATRPAASAGPPASTDPDNGAEHTGQPEPGQPGTGSQAGDRAGAGGDGAEAAPGRPPGRPPGGSGSGPTGQPPDGWPSRFAQVLAETLAGSRPTRQIVPWTTERALTRIQRLGPALSAGQQAQVRRVISSRPSRDVLEMTLIVGFGPRVRAVAVRLEREEAAAAAPGRRARPARWLCTAVEAA